MNISMHDFIYTTPIWSLVLFSFIPLIAKACCKHNEIRPLGVCVTAFLGFCFSIIFLYLTHVQEIGLFSNLLKLDHLSRACVYILSGAGIMTLPLFLAKKNHVVLQKFFPEYIFLFMNSVAGLILIAWSNHFLSAFIAVEHISLCFYLMIPLAKDKSASIESGLKYFILGSTAAGFFLLGISFIYITAGSLEFGQLIQLTPNLIQTNRFFVLGLAFTVLALLFKASIFPFQFWLPDVYQGSATPLTAFMAVAVKSAVFMLLLRLMFFINLAETSMNTFLVCIQWLAVLSLLIGHISALLQNNFKRMLIYSSIAHAGYMLMMAVNPSLFSISGILYYLVFYTIANFGALAYVMFFEKDNITGHPIQYLKGLYKSHPFYALGLTWFLLNLAGLPPTAGFFAKFFVFESLVQNQFWWMLFWAIIGSAIALFYYLRPIALMFEDKPEEKTSSFQNLKWVQSFIVLQLVLSILCIFITGDIYQYVFR